MSQDTYSDNAIARRVIRAREEAGLTQKDLADQLGLSKQGYSHYENQRGSFTVQQLFQLSRVLGKPIEWFLGIPTELNDEEAEVLHLWRQIENPTVRRLVLNSLRVGAGEERK